MAGEGLFKTIGVGNWAHLSASGDHVIKTGEGILLRVIINATADGAITIYDAVSSTDANKTVAVLKANIAEGSYEIGAKLCNGLCVKLASTSDVTIIYK